MPTAQTSCSNCGEEVEVIGFSRSRMSDTCPVCQSKIVLLYVDGDYIYSCVQPHEEAGVLGGAMMALFAGVAGSFMFGGIMQTFSLLCLPLGGYLYLRWKDSKEKETHAKAMHEEYRAKQEV